MQQGTPECRDIVTELKAGASAHHLGRLSHTAQTSSFPARVTPKSWADHHLQKLTCSLISKESDATANQRAPTVFSISDSSPVHQESGPAIKPASEKNFPWKLAFRRSCHLPDAREKPLNRNRQIVSTPLRIPCANRKCMIGY